jgi:hypothetical protein
LRAAYSISIIVRVQRAIRRIQRNNLDRVVTAILFLIIARHLIPIRLESIFRSSSGRVFNEEQNNKGTKQSRNADDKERKSPPKIGPDKACHTLSNRNPKTGAYPHEGVDSVPIFCGEQIT